MQRYCFSFFKLTHNKRDHFICMSSCPKKTSRMFLKWFYASVSPGLNEDISATEPKVCWSWIQLARTAGATGTPSPAAAPQLWRGWGLRERGREGWGGGWEGARFESMSFVVNILACKLKIVNNRNWKKT